jgi:hypothetical protein
MSRIWDIENLKCRESELSRTWSVEKFQSKVVASPSFRHSDFRHSGFRHFVRPPPNITNFNDGLGQWVCSDLFGVLTFRSFTFGASTLGVSVDSHDRQVILFWKSHRTQWIEQISILAKWVLMNWVLGESGCNHARCPVSLKTNWNFNR